MKEFIEKLISKLEEEKEENPCRHINCKDCQYTRMCCEGEQGSKVAIDNIIEIVNQLAEEYKTCYKSCTECEAYDKEKHYCPKWCDVIKNTVGEVEFNKNNGWISCKERLPDEKDYDDGYVEPSEKVLVFTKYGDYKTSRYWGNRRNQRDYYDWVDIEYRQDEVLAWQPLPTPYKESEEK